MIETIKPAKGMIDPGAEYPWFIPAPTAPKPNPPDREQLDLIEALEALPK